jgi:hypothetical protein
MKIQIAFLSLLALLLIGCTGDTSVSKQPSQAEIQAGIDRRVKEIDDNPNLSPEQKEQMKSHITAAKPGR